MTVEINEPMSLTNPLLYFLLSPAAGGVLMRTDPALIKEIQTMMAPQGASAPKCINIPRNQRTNRNPLWQYTCDGSPANVWKLQNWTPQQAAQPFWYQVADGGGKCWDLVNGQTVGGTIVQLYDCIGNGWPAQGWTFVPVPGMPQGHYTIRPYNSYNMCVNVYGGSSQDQAGIIIWPCDGSQNEIFYVNYSN